MLYEDDGPDDDLELARRIWRRRCLGALPAFATAAAVLHEGWSSRLLGKVSFLLLIPSVLAGVVSLALVVSAVAPPAHSTKQLATRARDARRQGAPLRARSWWWVLLVAVTSAALAGTAAAVMALLQS